MNGIQILKKIIIIGFFRVSLDILTWEVDSVWTEYSGCEAASHSYSFSMNSFNITLQTFDNDKMVSLPRRLYVMHGTIAAD